MITKTAKLTALAILIASSACFCSNGYSPNEEDTKIEDSGPSPIPDASDTGTEQDADIPDVADISDTENVPDSNDIGSIPFTDGVSTLTGWAEPGDADGSRAVAKFNNPVNVTYRNGMLYVADFDNGKLRKVNTKTYITSSIDVPSDFRRPFGLAFSSDEILYVSTDNNPAGENSDMTGTIWRFDLANETVEVVSSNMGRPRGIVVLPDGRIVVTDYLHHVVQIVDPQTGQSSIIAGAWDEPGMMNGLGTDARFFRPYGIELRSDNTLVVADLENHLIRLVALNGMTSTLAGSGVPGFSDGPTVTAQFDNPLGISIAGNDDIYVSDTENYRIRCISNDHVTTIAGDGLSGFADDNDLLKARFYGLEGLSVTPDSTMLYVADGNRGEDVPFNRIRQIQLF